MLLWVSLDWIKFIVLHPTSFCLCIDHLLPCQLHYIIFKTLESHLNTGYAGKSTLLIGPIERTLINCTMLISLYSRWTLLSCAAIPHPPHSHGWCGNRYGGHTRSHCSSLLPASLHHHRRCRQCWLHRHADSGWRWWSPTVTERWTGPPGHRAVCTLQRLQNGQFPANVTCSRCAARMLTDVYTTQLVISKSKQEAFAGFADATGVHDGLDKNQLLSSLSAYPVCVLRIFLRRNME